MSYTGVYKAEGDVLDLTAPYQRNAGEAAKVGVIIGVAVNTVANGAVGQFQLSGVFLLPKATGQTWSQGAKLYWDDSAKNFTTSSSSTTPAGVATVAAATGDTSGYVRLNGSY